MSRLFSAGVVVVALVAVGLIYVNNNRTLAGELTSSDGVTLTSVRQLRPYANGGLKEVDEDFTLTVRGLTQRQQVFSLRDIRALPKASEVVSLVSQEGWNYTGLWTGVPVEVLLDAAGADPNGRNLLFHGDDGYTSVLSQAYVRENNLILAYELNNKSLTEKSGAPLQLVARGKYAFKWVGQVDQITVTHNDFLDTPTRNGFDKDGSINRPWRAS